MSRTLFQKRLAKHLDTAVSRLERGESIEHIVRTSPFSSRAEIRAFLPIVAELRSIPIKSAGSPRRQYSFMNHSIERASRFARFMRSLRTGYAITGAFVLLLIVGVSSAAAQSLPGSPLFSLKKTWEIAQIRVVARTPGDRAQLELTLANQRLAEAQQVFSDESSDASDKAQAVQELDSQTQVALNQIQQVASTPTITNNPGIIKNLETLTQTQATLQAQVSPQTAGSTSSQNQQAVAAIQQTIASATNSQSSASINAPQQANANGTITALAASSFTIDKNVFQITNTTQFFSANGLHLQQSSFNIGDTVSVIGSVSGENNIANVITLDQHASASVSGSDQSSNQSPTGSSTVAPTPSQVTGGFILESPDPQ